MCCSLLDGIHFDGKNELRVVKLDWKSSSRLSDSKTLFVVGCRLQMKSVEEKEEKVKSWRDMRGFCASLQFATMVRDEVMRGRWGKAMTEGPTGMGKAPSNS